MRLHSSTGIMPFCWAEIWYAIENKIKAGICPYCWDVFLYPKYNYQKVHCGRSECKKAHLVECHGGEKGYREWERTRKSKKLREDK